MKHLLLFLIFLPFWITAQEDDTPYLAGAVPVADGRVIFTRDIEAPGRTRQQIYETLLAWTRKRFDGPVARVLYENAAEGSIACNGEEYLVFSQSFLSLDRTQINYRLIIECEDGGCRMEMTGIRYAYNVSYQPEPERYTAEEWITDENALNKKKTKLLRGNGKFRKKTIDLADGLFTEAAAALGIVSPGVSGGTTGTIAATPSATPTPASPATVTGENRFPGYRSVSPEKIPGNIIDLLANGQMLITIGTGQRFPLQTAGWGGLGRIFDKPAAFCFFTPGSPAYRQMEESDTYILAFYPAAGIASQTDSAHIKDGETGRSSAGHSDAAEARLIIECRKTAAQTLTPEAIADPRLKETQAACKLYIGEILRVWIK